MSSHWEIEKLGDLCTFENGDRSKNYPGRKAFVESGIPFINAGHLLEDGIDMENMNFISRESYDLLSSGKTKDGDILFCLRGSLGKYAIVDKLKEGAIASSLVIVRPGERIDRDFLTMYFGSKICLDMINKHATGAAQPNLSAASLKSFDIPLPPLTEQKRFAAIFVKAEAIRRKRQQAVKLTNDFIESLAQRAFRGEL